MGRFGYWAIALGMAFMFHRAFKGDWAIFEYGMVPLVAFYIQRISERKEERI
ncbi:MAG TPA: hypothetical protein VNI20_03475 [Fimbriimonadaceae bacterium]|nr:hypothetical protein [Fimbriimonadaceae bacterium]